MKLGLDAGCVLALVLSSVSAEAHFYLVEPKSSAVQDPLGDPQKSPPCGGGAATNVLTHVRKGATLSLTLRETIYHPGHFRIALVADGGALPPEPIVTAGTTACGSVVIDASPSPPVLADGVLVHTSPLSGDQTVQVQLPADTICDSCTLQVIQFMSSHGLNNPGGCYYHHCATLRISEDGPDGGSPLEPTVEGPTSPPAQGCTCAAIGGGPLFAAAFLALRLRARKAVGGRRG
jgi:hypothetical protein